MDDSRNVSKNCQQNVDQLHKKSDKATLRLEQDAYKVAIATTFEEYT